MPVADWSSLFSPFVSGTDPAVTGAILLALFGLLALSLIWAMVLLRRQRRMIAVQQEALSLQRSAADLHAMMNLSDAEGRITCVNDNLIRSTGYSEQELIGERARDMFLAGDIDADAVLGLLAKGQAWIGENRIRCRDGGALWTRATIVPQMDRDGRLKKVISLRTDITASKLRQQEGPVRAIFDRLQDEVYIFTVEDLRLVYLNSSARMAQGWDAAEYVGRSLAETTEGFDAAQFRERTRPLVTGETEALIYETTLWHRTVEINLQLLPSCNDDVSRFVAVVRDITQRRETERERADFVATVSHELRAPLTSVKGAMKLIASGATGEIPAKAERMIELALRNADRLIVLINDLLDLEKLDNASTEIHCAPVDLADLVAEAVAQNTAYAGEFGVGLTLLPGAPTALTVSGDRDRLMQVLTNLMSNAAKFSERGGSVEIGLADMGAVARISVTDHGIGIPEEAQARLFERFVQADTSEHKKRKGTGLGLSIVKSIVERHGGTVGFASVPGKGTSFHVDLPKPAAAESRAPLREAEAAVPEVLLP